MRLVVSPVIKPYQSCELYQCINAMNEVPGAKSSLSYPISAPSFNLTFCSLLLIPTTYKRKIYRESSKYSLLTVNRQRIHVTRKTESNTLLFIIRVHTLKTFFTFDKHSNVKHRP